MKTWMKFAFEINWPLKKDKIAQPVQRIELHNPEEKFALEKIWKKSKIRPRVDKKEYKKKDWNWTEIELKLNKKSPNRNWTKKFK